MLPRGYDPANYNGKIWWNENNVEMRNIWGTQADYDRHISQGGTWAEYEAAARLRSEQIRNFKESGYVEYLNTQKELLERLSTMENGSKRTRR